MAIMGMTVVVAAGDDGAVSSYNRDCELNPNSLGLGNIFAFSSSSMLPQYPASSAYVLSVGETNFLLNQPAYLSGFDQSITSPPECNNCPAQYETPIAFYCERQLW